MHIIQHLLGALRPDLIVTGMTKEADADDNVTFQRQALLCLHEGILKPGAPAERDDFIFSDHLLMPFFGFCD